MQVIALGTALVDCARLRTAIEALGERLLLKAYTQTELEYCHSRPHSTECFAAIWAAKDAILKALGLRAGGPERGQIEIRFENGIAQAVLSGVVKARAEQMDIGGFLLSTAHTRLSATATALGLRR
ncbi:MAG: 4'-phosphopantetheinyl transferase superfamily protein [Gemmataceae bacterium]|jgi:holo-[acyl-carrier protein] synthase|nr:4'-phosphopantetheinyl transferase superfamily protein [Gemmataceae bacterium]